MAKWGTYPPDEQLRLKRAAAGDLYEALEDARVVLGFMGGADLLLEIIDSALAKARGEA